MDIRCKKLIYLIGILCFLIATGCQSPVSFNQEIRPIFNNKCISCHGGVKQQGGFSLLFREEALTKTASGVYGIVPGNPSESEILKRIRHSDPELRMPYEKEPLSEEEVELISTWISQGVQ